METTIIKGHTILTTIADDLCDANDIYAFACDPLAAAKSRIGGVSFANKLRMHSYGTCGLEQGAIQELSTNLAEYIERKFISVLGKRMWVLLCTHLQRPNRISAHLKLWGHLQTQRQLNLTGLHLINETELVRGDEVCYAGIMDVAADGLPVVMDILHHYKGFGLLSDRGEVSSEDSIIDLLNCAYPSHGEEYWQNLAEKVCPLGDIVLRLPPFTDIPPHEYQIALDFFISTEELHHVKASIMGQ